MDQLLKKYIDNFNLDVLSSKSIIHEESLSSSIYQLHLKDKSIVILKVSFDEKRFQRENYFLNKVKDCIPVPKIISTCNPTDQLSGAILMQYVPGELVSDKNLDDDLSFQMGSLLATLHQIPVKYYGDIAEDQSLQPTLENALFIFKDKFKRSFEECKKHLDIDLLNKIEQFFYSSIENITYLDGPCITHRDFKPGNVIIQNNQIKSLIDWEIAKHSFAEEDFAQMEYLVWEKYPKTKQAFLKGYESIRKLPDLDVLMPILRVVKVLGAIGFTIERNTFKGVHKFVFDQNMKYLKKCFLI